MASSDKKLVIVESPTKARTIRKFLGDEYRVEASIGHVRDLPASADQIPEDIKGETWARLGVNVDDGYRPVYVVPPGKKKIVSELKKALKDASVLFLATDEDREGESIGWHLVQLLQPKIPTHRMVFHEITKEAIEEALSHPRELDGRLVQAQETRRVLDRLVGYTVSPLLWRKVKPKLSAGRVQSVAVRILALRERERMAFVTGTYWDLKAELQHADVDFDAQLVSFGGTRLATGKDFDENTGKIPEDKDVLLLDEKEANELVEGLRGQKFRVSEVETRHAKRSPYPPFTTSTLQQEANRKLGLGARRTMQVAQRLYEQGFITYMRTDSVNLSDQAVEASRARVTDKYGAEYLSEKPRQYSTKSKGAQEAHEAIRPSGSEMLTSDELKLAGMEAKLYDMIWKRTIATQMAEARLAFTTARFEVKAPGSERVAEFRASGREVVFPGFFRAYVEGSDDPDEALEDRSAPLPQMKEDDHVACLGVEPLGHETKPPARYTQATLVKALESEGVGRPSTYASIIDTVQRRGYVFERGKQLIPSFTGMAVTALLEAMMESLVDVQFTAAMERTLDAIVDGKDPLDYLDQFYKHQLLDRVASGAELDAKAVCTIASQKTAPYFVHVGRYGPYIEFKDGEEDVRRASLNDETPPADVTREQVEALIKLSRRGKEPLGDHPETGEPVYVLTGPYGPYVQLGEQVDPKSKPKRTSVPPSIDPLTVELDIALKLLSLPRVLGEHPETAKKVKAGMGRYGPYVQHERIYASLKPDEDDVLSVGLDRALELLKDKKPRRRQSEPVKVLGDHPEDKEPVQIMDGPYGMYIKWGKVNAPIPEDDAPDDLSLEQAVVLIEARLERIGKAPPKKKKGKASKASAKKATTKKAATKKATKKKTAKKKATTKKAASKKAPAKKKATKKKATKKKTAKKKAT